MVATIGRVIARMVIGTVLAGCSVTSIPPTAVIPPPFEVVTINQVEITSADPNLICVTAFTSDGKADNSSCTSPTATKPMIGISGTNDAHTSVVVLDPTKQAVAMRIRLGEEWISVPLTHEVQEANLFAVQLVHSPNVIEVVDENGRILSSVPPQANHN